MDRQRRAAMYWIQNVEVVRQRFCFLPSCCGDGSIGCADAHSLERTRISKKDKRADWLVVVTRDKQLVKVMGAVRIPKHVLPIGRLGRGQWGWSAWISKPMGDGKEDWGIWRHAVQGYVIMGEV